jgi:putative tryptophan/tyrosine transport system substrate-binding protein
MRRREFIGLLAGGAVARPITARGQQPALPVIGFLSSESSDLYARFVRSFRQGLEDRGYVEGRTVAIEYRWADGQYARLPALAADLLSRRVALIVANPPAVLPAKNATSTTPIVFTTSLDPVQAGIVPSLNRPGGNLTGITSLNVEVEPKRLELLHEMLPAVRIVAALVNPAGPNADTESKNLQAAARTLGVELHILHASTEDGFDRAFADIARLGAGALLVASDPLFLGRGDRLGALSLGHHIPAIWQGREFVEAGGLMSYGTNIVSIYRQLGVLAGRILKGESPADLPVQQVTNIELIINMKTAAALGLTFPLTLLGRADQVVE